MTKFKLTTSIIIALIWMMSSSAGVATTETNYMPTNASNKEDDAEEELAEDVETDVTKSEMPKKRWLSRMQDKVIAMKDKVIAMKDATIERAKSEGIISGDTTIPGYITRILKGEDLKSNITDNNRLVRFAAAYALLCIYQLDQFEKDAAYRYLYYRMFNQHKVTTAGNAIRQYAMFKEVIENRIKNVLPEHIKLRRAKYENNIIFTNLLQVLQMLLSSIYDYIAKAQDLIKQDINRYVARAMRENRSYSLEGAQNYVNSQEYTCELLPAFHFDNSSYLPLKHGWVEMNNDFLKNHIEKQMEKNKIDLNQLEIILTDLHGKFKQYLKQNQYPYDPDESLVDLDKIFDENGQTSQNESNQL